MVALLCLFYTFVLLSICTDKYNGITQVAEILTIYGSNKKFVRFDANLRVLLLPEAITYRYRAIRLMDTLLNQRSVSGIWRCSRSGTVLPQHRGNSPDLDLTVWGFILKTKSHWRTTDLS